MSSVKDFEIQNNVLKKHNSSDADIVIPDNVMLLHYRAFSGCDNIVLSVRNGSYAE